MKKTSIFLLILLVAQLSFAQVDNTENLKFPESIGYVNDFEGIFLEEQISELNTILEKHEQATTNQIVVISISSYAPYETLYQYSLDMANEWGVGQKDKDNGVTIVFGKEIKEIRIQVGLGLEDELTDAEAKFIIDNIIIPEFKKGDFYTGIKKGVLKIIEEIK